MSSQNVRLSSSRMNVLYHVLSWQTWKADILGKHLRCRGIQILYLLSFETIILALAFILTIYVLSVCSLLSKQSYIMNLSRERGWNKYAPHTIFANLLILWLCDASTQTSWFSLLSVLHVSRSLPFWHQHWWCTDAIIAAAFCVYRHLPKHRKARATASRLGLYAWDDVPEETWITSFRPLMWSAKKPDTAGCCHQ